MNVLIIENEKPAADKLRYLLEKIDKNILIVGIVETVLESVNWIQENPHPDLILMDIQLDDGLSFEIFETVSIDIPIIFTTAYNEYVFQAFKVNSVDYLLKPLEEDALRAALDKFKTVHYRFNGDLFKNIFEGLKKQYKTRFLVKISHHYKSIPIAEISCFYILERAVFLRTLEGKEYAIDYSLDQIQKIIDPDKYFRLNRNCIVFINAISEIVSFSSSRLQLKLDPKIKTIDKDFLVISRERVREFKKWMDR